MKYTEYQLIQLAKNNPQELVKIINSHNDIKTIISTVDILSTEVSEESIVFPILNRLLKHIHATVRESALSGVSSFYTEKRIPPEILKQLEVISNHDPSLLLREYAQDLLLKDK